MQNELLKERVWVWVRSMRVGRDSVDRGEPYECSAASVDHEVDVLGETASVDHEVDLVLGDNEVGEEGPAAEEMPSVVFGFELFSMMFSMRVSYLNN